MCLILLSLLPLLPLHLLSVDIPFVIVPVLTKIVPLVIISLVHGLLILLGWVFSSISLLLVSGASHCHQLQQQCAEVPLLSDSWSAATSSFLHGNFGFLSNYIVPDLDDASHVASLSPHLLLVKSSKYNEDNPSWEMAMNGPYALEYWRACEIEMNTLQNEMESWTLVHRTPDMKVLPSTWAFHLKRYPDGSPKKFKARFCVRGDFQKDGVDVFETWSPVVEWSTVCLLLVISSMLKLHTAQADVTAAFLHAPLKPNKKIYVHQARGFKGDPDYVYSLSRSVYGLKAAPKYWFDYISDKFIKYKLEQSTLDNCLFVGQNLIAVIYVDDVLLFAHLQSTISTFVTAMVKNNIQLHLEGTAEGLLGVDIQRHPHPGDGSRLDQLILTQSSLIKHLQLVLV